MRKAILAVLALSFAACLYMPAAAETFTSSDGVISIELPGENWKEVEDSTKWIVLSDGSDVLTIEHLSNGEKLPDMAVADDHFINVYQAVYSTQNEVFIITGSVVDAAKIPEVTNMILSAKVLKYDTKTAVRKENTASLGEFSVVAADATMYVTADGLNVRAGWSTDDQILGTLDNGTAVHVTGVVQRNGEDYGWYQVSYGNASGYVSAGFLSDSAPEQKKDPGTGYTGNVKTVYAEDGTSITLYEATDGYWYDKDGITYVRISDDMFGVKDGNKRLTTYPPSTETPAPEPIAYLTVYDESGASFTLYEDADGYWRDRSGTAYTRMSDTEFQVYEGTKRVFTYDISAVTNDYSYDDNSQGSSEAAPNGVVTAYEEDGTAVTLYESADGYWYDSNGTAYTRHSDTDFQVFEGNRHLTVY